MSSTEDPNGGKPPAGEAASVQPEQPVFDHDPPYADDSYTYQGAPGPVQPNSPTVTPAAPNPSVPTENVPAVRPPAPAPTPPRKPPPPPPPPDEPGGDDEEGMLRMSFMEHLEGPRTRRPPPPRGAAVVF